MKSLFSLVLLQNTFPMMSSQQLIQRLYPYRSILGKEGHTAVENVLSVGHHIHFPKYRKLSGECVATHEGPLLILSCITSSVEIWAPGWSPSTSTKLSRECVPSHGCWWPCRCHVAYWGQRHHIPGIPRGATNNRIAVRKHTVHRERAFRLWDSQLL